MKGAVLVVDDDRAFRVSTAALLRDEGHDVITAANGPEAVDRLAAGAVDLVLLDLRMPGLDGIALAEVLRARGEGVPILMVTGFGDVDTAVTALHTGIDDFITKPVEPDVLAARVASLLERRPRPEGPGSGSPADSGALAQLLGRSPAMERIRASIRRVAATDASVLVLGETGTGKELVARAVHDASLHRSGPFVPVNAASLAEGLLESELFGHVRGAFTGAVQDRQGYFRAAEGGTVFLDEVGDLSPSVQRRLLRVLQERALVPLGTSRAVPIDVRVVAATNRDLPSLIESGEFREDLYYRLDVFRIELPPLRERRMDIPLLAEAFLARRSPPPPPCSPFTMRILQAYGWSGNVRELFSALESAAIRADGGRIEAQHLPPEIRERSGKAASAPGTEGGRGGGRRSARVPGRYAGALSPDEERAKILAALDETRGNRSQAAELLGMGRTTLWRKMREHGIDLGD